MVIEYCNVSTPRSHASLSVAIVVAACAFFFIPTTLIILGYYSSQPTGTLISPLPQGVLSEQVTPSIAPRPATVSVTPSLAPVNSPIIAAPEIATPSSVMPESASNIVDHVASISAGVTSQIVNSSDIQSSSQIYLSPRTGDRSVYSVKSKSAGQFTISVDSPSDTVRYVDYHIVNP